MHKNPETHNTSPLNSTRIAGAALAITGLYIPSLVSDSVKSVGDIHVSANAKLIDTTNPHQITAPLSLASGGPGSGEPSKTTTTTVYNQTPTYHINASVMEKNSEFMHIPNEAQKFMDANTVYLSTIGCSGTIIRKGNEIDGKPIGIAFAKHCGFLPNAPTLLSYDTAKYVTGSNGEDYTIKWPIIAQTGTASNELAPIGGIDKVIVPLDSNDSVDKAFGILSGATAKEVISSYEKESLTEEEITKKLIPGKSIVYMRGWPVNQKNNSKEGFIKTQEFAMPYLGTITTETDTGEELSVVMAAIPKVDSKVDEAVCSFGASGSGGFVIENGEARLLGTLSSFWGLTPLVGAVDSTIYNNSYAPKQNRDYFKYLFPNINWDNYSAVCGFSYKSADKYKVVHVVPNLANIPGHIQPELEAIYEKQQLFVDPEYPRTIVDGKVLFMQKFEGKEAQPIYVRTVINRPIIDIDKKNGHVFIGFYTGETGIINVAEVNNLKDLTFYPINKNSPIHTLKSSGQLKFQQLSYNQSLDPKTGGSLVDNKGFHFGEDGISAPWANDLEGPHRLEIKDGKMVFIKTKNPKTPPVLQQGGG
jgi:hypothetical protein